MFLKLQDSQKQLFAEIIKGETFEINRLNPVDVFNVAALHGNVNVLAELAKDKKDMVTAIKTLLKHGHISKFQELWKGQKLKISPVLLYTVLEYGNQDAIAF
ncbi:MAG: hypothetical protein LW825_05865 [Candidatus Jidaibacter sp.]|nr:hypothetical protein [Candidatus Jidaibacter sp.]